MSNGYQGGVSAVRDREEGPPETARPAALRDALSLAEPYAETTKVTRIRLLGRGFLVLHVDHLHPAVVVRHRIAGILELGLAVSDRDQIAARDAVFVGQIALDGVGTALRQVLVVGIGAGDGGAHGLGDEAAEDAAGFAPD